MLCKVEHGVAGERCRAVLQQEVHRYSELCTIKVAHHGSAQACFAKWIREQTCMACVLGGWTLVRSAAGTRSRADCCFQEAPFRDARTRGEYTALHLAALCDRLGMCLLLPTKAANLRVGDRFGNFALRSLDMATCGYWADPEPTPLVKVQRVAELTAAFRSGCHPLQVQDDNSAKGGNQRARTWQRVAVSC